MKDMSEPQSLTCLHVPCSWETRVSVAWRSPLDESYKQKWRKQGRGSVRTEPRVQVVRASRGSCGLAAAMAAKRERRMGRESCMAGFGFDKLNGIGVNFSEKQRRIQFNADFLAQKRCSFFLGDAPTDWKWLNCKVKPGRAPTRFLCPNRVPSNPTWKVAF